MPFSKLLRLIVTVALTLLLGWVAFSALAWDQVLSTVQRLSIAYTLLAFAILIVAGLARAYRWQLLFTKDTVSTFRLFRVQNEGIGLNNLMPFGIASEATQWLILTSKDRISGAVALSTLAMERVIGLASALLVLALGFLVYRHISLFLWYSALTSALAAGVFLVLPTLTFLTTHVHFLQKFHTVRSLAYALQELQHAHLRLALSLTTSVGYWFLIGTSVWAVALALSLPISLMAVTLVTTGAITFVTTVPVTPAAVGTFELATVYGLGLLGIDKEAALGFAVIVHALFFIPPTLIAVLLIPQEHIGTLGHVRRLATKFSSNAKVTGNGVEQSQNTLLSDSCGGRKTLP